MDVGDHLIIVNAAKVVLTGGKETKKVAWRHSGHPGGITGTLYEDLLAKKPAFAVEKAVRGMLPKNRLGRAMIKKLHVVPGPEHRHQAQKPVDWAIGTRPAWEGLPTSAPGPANGKMDAKEGAAAEPDEAGSAKPAAPRKAPARKPAGRKPTAAKTTAKASTRKTTATRKSTAKATTKTTATTRKSTAKRKPTETRKSTAKKPSASTARKKET
jgi:hypothetical protein